MVNDVVYKRLKKIEDLPGDWINSISEYDDSEEYSSNGLFINSEMAKRFGDGKKYEFRQVRPDGYGGGDYTHKSDDYYYYHKSWFIDEPEVELEPELFEI